MLGMGCYRMSQNRLKTPAGPLLFQLGLLEMHAMWRRGERIRGQECAGQQGTLINTPLVDGTFARVADWNKSAACVGCSDAKARLNFSLWDVPDKY